ncbi:uncharacterized protein LOC124163883 [Ischnura elegans]|uniref:uncharacterized protein LOC124163883 n=1 Tax=Ischnura elegans TaxID=197161 RepID=UPI001ED87065|nr:uncharacterized protein LOC124163883 [Ischnura elegans]
MPKVKSDKKEGEKPYETEGRKGGWGRKKAPAEEEGESGEAAAVQGAGFKDKEKAQETVRILDGRDPCYAFYVVNSMFHRAKLCIKRTKDEEKIKHMEEAMAVFEAWLDDYRAHNRARENCAYLPLDVIEGYLPLAKRYGLPSESSDEPTFLNAYRKAEGEMKKLRTVPVDENHKDEVNGHVLTWDIERNRRLKAKLTEIRENHLPLFETDIDLKGLPTKDHMELILLAYSPDVTKTKKAMSLLKEKLGVSNGEDSKGKESSSSAAEDSS